MNHDIKKKGSYGVFASVNIIQGYYDAAGIVNHNYGWLYNCYNRGIVVDSYWVNMNCASCFCGIVYRNDGYGIVDNCYSAGVFSYPEGDYWTGVYGNGICMKNYGRGVTNCYVLSASGQSNKKKGRVSYEELADPSFVQEIDQQTYSVLPVWKEDVNKINGGLPITAADESFLTGQCKIQPEAWILDGQKVIEANLEDKKFDLSIYCYYNDSAPIVTVEDTDIAEISGDGTIQFKKAGTTHIDIQFTETENNSSSDYQLTLKIKDNTGNAHKHNYNTNVRPAVVNQNGSITKTCTECGEKTSTKIYAPKTITLSKTSFTYNNKNHKPSVTIKDSKGKALSSKTDYTISYPKAMKNVGSYIVTIKFKGNYSGTVKKTFTIVPKGTSISKITPKKKGFAVKWKKQTAQTTGYEIAYSTDSKFSKKNTKIVSVGKNNTTSKSVSKLKDKKKYYVRIRTYKIVKGKKYYSGWSNIKNIATK